MKKFFIYAFTIASLITTTQVNAQKGFSLNVKATPQFSFLANKDDNDNDNFKYKPTVNASFGIGAAYNFTRSVGVGVDVLYSLQGQRYKINDTREYNQKNEYVKVPVYFSYNLNATKKFALVGKLGPQLSFLTNSKLDDEDGNKIIGDTKDRYQSATFGAMTSIGAQYKLNRNLYLTGAFRFDADFTNAEDDQYPDYATGRAKTYNTTSGVELGLKYAFAK